MTYLDETGHRLVSAAVTEAESATSGEIVTVLADTSDGYTDVALLWAAGAAFTAMSAFAALPQPFLDLWDAAPHVWQAYHGRVPEADMALDRAAGFLQRAFKTA